MNALRQIRVANDNRPDLPGRARLRVPAEDRIAEAVPARPVALANASGKRAGRVRALAAFYQIAAIGFTVMALLQGADPYAVAGLASLATLGGVGVLSGWNPKRLLGGMGREASGILAALTANIALIIIAPMLFAQGLQDPIILSALTFAAFGAVFALDLCIVTALGGLAMVAVAGPIGALPLTTSVQLGAIFGLSALGAKRSGSLWSLATVLSTAIAALWLLLSQSGLHPTQSFGTLAIAGLALHVSVSETSTRMKAAGALGLAIALAGCLVVQTILLDPAGADSVLQPGLSGTALAGFLVAMQAVVLGINLLRWLGGRIGWLGVVLPQLALAAAAMLLIDPSVMERVTRVPSAVDLPGLTAALIGCGVLGYATLGVWQNWYADRPVRTGLFAMLVMVQLGLLWRVAKLSPELGVACLAATCAALCAFRLCAPILR